MVETVEADSVEFTSAADVVKVEAFRVEMLEFAPVIV